MEPEVLVTEEQRLTPDLNLYKVEWKGATVYVARACEHQARKVGVRMITLGLDD